MVNNEAIKSLYKALLNNGYTSDNIGDENTFATMMSDKNNRKKLYDFVTSNGSNIGDYETYERRLSSDLPSQNNRARAYKDSYDTANQENDTLDFLNTQQSQAYTAGYRAEAEKKLAAKEQAEQTADEAAVMRGYLESTGQLERLDEMKKQAEDEMAKHHKPMQWWEHFIPGYNMYRQSQAVENRLFNDEYRTAAATRDKVEEVQDLIDEASHADNGWLDKQLGGVVRGTVDAATKVSTWDFGATGTANAYTLNDIIERQERGEQLTASEQNLLDAYGLASAIEYAYQDQVGMGYNVGQSLPESLGFMASMYVNPLSGAGKVIGQRAARAALRRYGNSLTSRVLTRGARVGGDIVGMAGVTATTGLGRVAEDYFNRVNGQSTFDIDENGIIRYGGQMEREEAEAAIFKALGSMFIENYTEALGEYFTPLGDMISGVVKGGMRRAGLNKFADALDRIKSSQWSQAMDNFAKKAKFNGFVGELMEEEIGMVMNALTVGDMNFNNPDDKNSVFNPENQLTTLLSVALMQGTMYGIRAAGNKIGSKIIVYNQLNRARSNAARLWGDRWDDLAEQLDGASEEQKLNILLAAANTPDITDEQKKALYEYAARLTSYQAYNRRSMLNREEMTEDARDVEAAQEAGMTMFQPEKRYLARRQTLESERALYLAMDELNDEQKQEVQSALNAIQQGFQDGASPNEIMDIVNGMSNENMARLTKNYILMNVREAAIRESAIDQVTENVAERRESIMAKADAEGNITTATFRDEPVFVVGTNGHSSIIVNENGERKMVSTALLYNMQTESVNEMMTNYEELLLSQTLSALDKDLNHHPKSVEPHQGMLLRNGEAAYVVQGIEPNGNVVVLPSTYDVASGQYVPNKNTNPLSISQAEAMALQDNFFAEEDAKANNMSAETAENASGPVAESEQNDIRDTDLMPDEFEVYGKRSRIKSYQNGVATYVDESGEVSIILSGTSEHDFVGVFRDETGRWSSKMENASRNKENFRRMISSVMSQLPKGAVLYEHTNVSADGLRVFAQQLAHGFERSGETYTTGLNGADVGNVLGERFRDDGSMNSIFANNRELQEIRQKLKPYMEALGMTVEDITLDDNGKVQVRLPLLIKQTYSVEDNNQNSATEVAAPTSTQPIEVPESISKEIDEMRSANVSDEIINATIVDRTRKAKNKLKSAREQMTKPLTGKKKPKVEMLERERLLKDAEAEYNGWVAAGRKYGVESIDNQGNRVDIEGNLILEDINDISELTEKDFIEGTRSVRLPAVPERVANAIGSGTKPFIIKKNIFEKNRKSHRDLSVEDSINILYETFYNPNLYGQNQKATRPYNWILVHLADKNTAVIVEVNDKKDNVEIVNWHYLNDKQLEQKKNQAIREGGLILTFENAAGNTSNSLASADKDNGNIEESKENQQKNEIPVENGNLLYHLVPTDVTLASINSEGLEEQEVDAFVANKRKKAEQLLNNVRQKPPKMGDNIKKYKEDKAAWEAQVADAQAQVDYWDNIAKELKELRKPIGEEVAEEILQLGEVMSGEELAAQMLAQGSLPLLQSSYKEHTGGGRGETKGMIGLFRTKEKGGLTVERAGELLALADEEEYNGRFFGGDSMVATNALLEVLSQVETRGGLTNYIREVREQQAKREQEAEYAAYEQAIQAMYGVSVAEYEAMEEQIAQVYDGLPITDDQYTEFINTFVDEFNALDNGRQSERDAARSEGSSEVLRSEQLDNEEGVRGVEEQSEETDGGSSDQSEVAQGEEQQVSGFTLSGIDSGKGGNFYQDINGNIDLVDVIQEVMDALGIPNVPFRMTESMANHILKQHGEEIKVKSKEDVVAFVVDIMKNFDHVRQGNDAFSYVFSIENDRAIGKRAITIILPSENGEYLGVKSSGFERSDRLQRRPLLWEKGANETSATDTASVNVTSETAQQGGEPNSSASNQSNGLTADKGSEVSENDKETGEKVADTKLQGVMSEREFINTMMNDGYENRADKSMTMEEWLNSDDSTAIQNEIYDSYPDYIQGLKDNGTLQQAYDNGTVGERIKIREAIETAGFEVNDMIDTSKEKADAKSKREEKKRKQREELMRKLGINSDGTIMLVEDENGEIVEDNDDGTTTRYSIVNNDETDLLALAERVAKEEKRRKPLRERARKWSKTLGVKVNLIERIEDVEDRAAATAIRQGIKVAGWFNEKTGEVCFYMPNIDNMEEMDKTFIHEVVAHKGLRALLGNEAYNKVLDKVWDMMPESVQEEFLDYPGVNGNKRAAADEYIASLAEKQKLSPKEKTIWETIVNLFREALNKVLNGIMGKDALTEKDIETLIKLSYENLRSGASDVVGGEGTRFRTLEEAEELLETMKTNAENLVPRQLTKEIWENEIKDKVFYTPIGKVRFGENQYEKNLSKGRAKEFGMIIPTIERPDIVFEEDVFDENAERQSKYVFVKTFLDEMGNKHINYASITIKKDGMEIVESSHHLRDKQVLNKIIKEQMLWNRFASDSASSVQNGSTEQSNALFDSKYNTSESNKQEKSRFRVVSPEMDAEYLEAVNSGDMDKAQKMVNEAAKMAMPNTEIVDKEGYPMMVYHGTNASFNIFDDSFSSSNTGAKNTSLGFFFTPHRTYAESIGGKDGSKTIMPVFLNITNPFEAGFAKKTNGKFHNGIERNPFDYRKAGSFKDGLSAIKDAVINKYGQYTKENAKRWKSEVEKYFDGLKIMTGDSSDFNSTLIPTMQYVAFNPSQIKSAEPVTYDDNGNVIPLSERFNPDSNDIRFRRVYHGSGSEFDRFDHSFMGTGEGAQAFGWGTYVSDMEGIARGYANASAVNNLLNMDDNYATAKAMPREELASILIKKEVSSNGRDFEKAKEYVISNLESSLDDDFDAETKQFINEVINATENVTEEDIENIEGIRHLYNVDIPENDGTNFISWQTDNSQEVIDKLNNAYKNLLIERGVDEEDIVPDFAPFSKGLSGESIYRLLARELGSDREASNFLSRQGFVGIEYPTGTLSGGNTDGTKNYVIFNEHDLDIVEHTRFRAVTDKKLIDKLESEPKIKVYRAMQLVDGKLYPPMSAKVDGKMREPIELGKWEEAEERPDMADEKGYFKLNKGNGKSLKARYNPYIHTSTTPLNDQFSSAQDRPELVTVEVEVPESELTSGYKADKAKDAVGKLEWKAGVVQGKLSGTRTVILSRWDKPIRIVPDSEVADEIVKMFGDKQITMPSNVVTPSLRSELEKRGVPFVETDNQGREVGGTRFKVVYHGSASDFDKFDHSKMGSGAGSQVFGWGTYVTDSEKIGRDYGDVALQGRNKFKYAGSEDVNKWVLADAEQIMDRAGSYEEAIKRYGNKTLAPGTALEEVVAFLKSTKKEDWQGQRHLYEVEIPDMKRGNYIVYGNNVTDKAADKVFNGIYERISKNEEYDSAAAKKGLRKELDSLREAYGQGKNGIWKDLYGDIATYLGSEKEASMFLRSLGYVGIEYPSGTIYKDEYGDAKNYVIFDEKDLKITNRTRFRVSGDPFYSNAERAVEGIKQEKATPQQWLAMIEKNGGLKAGEDKWLGLSDWLKASDKKSLTKQEVLDFINANKIQIEEVNYGGGEWEAKLDALNEEFRELIDEGEEATGSIYTSDWVDYAYEAMVDRYGDDFRDAFEVAGQGTAASLEATYDWNDNLSGAAQHYLGVENPINSTREGYTTEGLENKQEIALTVPTIESWNESDEIHFGDAGDGRAVAWVRFGETTDADGSRVLVIDEIQSKRHQDARVVVDKNTKKRRGYEPIEVANFREADNALNSFKREMQKKYGFDWSSASEEEINQINKLEEDYSKADEALHQKRIEMDKEGAKMSDIPSAPFETNWHELAMKRMLRYAAENGYDKVAWTKGAQQAERYDLAKQVSSIEYAKLSNGHYKVIAYGTNGYPIKDIPAVYNNEQEIAEMFGKEIAVKVMQGIERSERAIEDHTKAKQALREKMKGVDEDSAAYEAMLEEYALHDNIIDGAKRAQTIEGDDLSIGGEGMKGFYDEMLPRFMNKYGKKWGAKVGEVELPDVEESARKMWSVDVTDAMKESVMEGQPMFRVAPQWKGGEVIGVSDTLDGYVANEGLTGEYTSPTRLLDAFRNKYPQYFAELNSAGNIVVTKWSSIFSSQVASSQVASRNEGKKPLTKKQQRAVEYAEREANRRISSVEQMADRLHIKVRILTDTKGLKGKAKRAKGWYDVQSGEITILMPNHVSMDDVMRTILHEAVAHHGLRTLFGKHFNTFLDNVYSAVPESIRAEIVRMASVNGWDIREATEEYLASLAEDTNFENAVNEGWFAKVKELFLKLLAKVGYRLRNGVLTDNDLRYILWRSYENLKNPGERDIFDFAKDVVMQDKLGVRGYESSPTQSESAADSGRRFRVSKADAEDARREISKFIPRAKNARLFSKPIDLLNPYNGLSFADRLVIPYLMLKNIPIRAYYSHINDSVVMLLNNLDSKAQAKSSIIHEYTHLAVNKLLKDGGITESDLDDLLDFCKKSYPDIYKKATYHLYKDKDHAAECAAFLNQHFYGMLGDKLFEDATFAGKTKYDKLFSKILNELKNGEGTDENNPTSGGRGRQSVSRRGSGFNAEYGSGNGGEQGVQGTDSYSSEGATGRVDAATEGVRFRVSGNTPLQGTTTEAWDRMANSALFQLRETMVDHLTAIEKFQDLIAKRTNSKVLDFENSYQAMLHLSSTNKTEMDLFDSFVYNPLNDVVAKLAGGETDWEKGKLRELVVYLMAKHGLERNRQMAVEKAAAEDKQTRKSVLEAWQKEKEAIQSSTNLTWEQQQRELDNVAIRYGADLNNDYSGLSDKTLFGDDAIYKDGWQKAAYDAVVAYENANGNLTTQLWQHIGNATAFSLKKQLDSGLVDKDYVSTQLDRFQYYVPLRGFGEEIASDVYNYINDSKKEGNPVKTASGRISEADNPLAGILQVAYSSIATGNKNRAKQRLLNFVQNHDTEGLAQVNKGWIVKYDMAVNDPLIQTPQLKQGETAPEWVEALPVIPSNATSAEIAKILADFEARMNELKGTDEAQIISGKNKTKYRTLHDQLSQHQVVVMQGGRPYVITIVGNPRLAQAINGLLNPDVDNDTLSKMAQSVQRFMAGAFTSHNIAFSFANIARDTMYSNNQAFIKENPLYWAKFTANQKLGFGNWPKMMSMLHKFKNGTLDTTNAEERLFDEFMRNGGATGYTFVDSQRGYGEKLAKQLEKLGNGSAKVKMQTGMQNVLDCIEFMGQSAEIINRFAAYKTGREMGRSVSRSITDAKEITVNFNRKGAGKKTVSDKSWINFMAGVSQYGRDYMLFWNANMQAKYRLYKNMKEHPIKTSTTLIGNSMMLGGLFIPMLNNVLLPTLYAAFGMGSDDDEEEYYNVLTDWERTHNICIRLPKGNWLKVPLSPEMTPFYSMGDIINGNITGKRPFKTSDYYKNVIDVVSPVSVNWSYEGWAFGINFVPTVFQPAVQNFANVNFMGNPLAKKGYGGRDLDTPEFRNVYSSASSSLTALSKLTNKLTGGDGVSKGALDWNPAYVQNLISGYLGGYGTTALAVADWVVSTTNNEPQAVITSKFPIVSRFYISGNKDVKQRRLDSRYYDVENFISDIDYKLREYNKGKEGKLEGIIEIADATTKLNKLENSDEYQLYLELKETSKDIKAKEKYVKENGEDELTLAQINEWKLEALEKYDALKK